MNLTGALTAGVLIALGFAAFRRRGAAATAPPTTPSGMPAPMPGESGADYMNRVEAWGLSTGQVYPTMEGLAGFGRTGSLWRSAGMVPRRR